MIKHRRSGDAGQIAEQTAWISRLRHPLERRHARDVERRHQAAYERLAERMEEVITGLGLIKDDHSIGACRVYHTTQVISVHPGPPLGVDIRILPDQSPEDCPAHAAATAYDPGMANVPVVLGPAGVAGLRRVFTPSQDQPVGLVGLCAAATLAVLVADLSGLSKAEVERIWLPFAVWLIASTGILPTRQTRAWLAAQAIVALTVNHLLLTTW